MKRTTKSKSGAARRGRPETRKRGRALPEEQRVIESLGITPARARALHAASPFRVHIGDLGAPAFAGKRIYCSRGSRLLHVWTAGVGASATNVYAMAASQDGAHASLIGMVFDGGFADVVTLIEKCGGPTRVSTWSKYGSRAHA